MTVYNFSFGSNMSSSRLLARLPEAKRVGTAVLKGYELTFDMVSTDGSAKCSIRQTDEPEALVYGVVYQLSLAEKAILDETFQYANCPDELWSLNWAGCTEVRKMSAEQLIEVVDYYLSELELMNLWEFAATYVPMTAEQKMKCLDKMN